MRGKRQFSSFALWKFIVFKENSQISIGGVWWFDLGEGGGAKPPSSKTKKFRKNVHISRSYSCFSFGKKREGGRKLNFCQH